MKASNIILAITLIASAALGCFESNGSVVTADTIGGDNIAVYDNTPSGDIVCPKGTALRSRKADGTPPLECLPTVDEEDVDDTSTTDVATSEVESDPCAELMALGIDGTEWDCYDTEWSEKETCALTFVVVDTTTCGVRCWGVFFYGPEDVEFGPPPINSFVWTEPDTGLRHNCYLKEEKW